jgi:hypothetical protein
VHPVFLANLGQTVGITGHMKNNGQFFIPKIFFCYHLFGIWVREDDEDDETYSDYYYF